MSLLKPLVDLCHHRMANKIHHLHAAFWNLREQIEPHFYHQMILWHTIDSQNKTRLDSIFLIDL